MFRCVFLSPDAERGEIRRPKQPALTPLAARGFVLPGPPRSDAVTWPLKCQGPPARGLRKNKTIRARLVQVGISSPRRGGQRGSSGMWKPGAGWSSVPKKGEFTFLILTHR